MSVPEVDGQPILTDGIFTPGEWDDALRLPLNQDVELRLKQVRGVVYLGLRGVGKAEVGPSDLFVAVPGGSIHHLHVSAQLYETELPPSGEPARPRFGLTTGWYANEFRRDEEAAARLRSENRPPIEIIRGSSYPCDGVEFAIRRSRFPGARWLLRLQTGYFAGDRPTPLVFPANTAERSVAGWMELKLD